LDNGAGLPCISKHTPHVFPLNIFLFAKALSPKGLDKIAKMLQ
jgi:hypothetical protein